MDLQELVAMSNRYGQNPDYVLAGGGNTSVKDDTTLYVKCSGTCLADITADGFVAMDKQALCALMEKEYPDGDAEREAAFLRDVMEARTDADPQKRPSVEALLHSLFPQKYVLHVHPALINGLTCGQGSGDLAYSLLGNDVLWIPLCRPGYTLGKLCFKAMAEYEKKQGRKAQILLLQNHGIFVAGDTVEEIDRLFALVENRLKTAVKKWPDLAAMQQADAGKAWETALELSAALGVPAEPLDVREALRFTENETAADPLLRPFTPDHIVYCGPFPLYLNSVDEAKEKYEAFEAEKGFLPKILLVEGVGAFAADKSSGTREKAKLLLTDAMKVAVYAKSFGGALPMTEELTEFILHWEAESYRKKKSE